MKKVKCGKTKSQKSYAKILSSTIFSKRLTNIGYFCNGTTHPYKHRPYRRGAGRCLECGAKFGKGEFVWKSMSDDMVEHFHESTPLFDYLSRFTRPPEEGGVIVPPGKMIVLPIKKCPGGLKIG